MKSNIHPNCKSILAKCVCGHDFHFHSALDAESMNIEVCNGCHPFYTGTQKTTNITGRVESFNNRYQNNRQQAIAKTTTTKPIKEKKSRK